MFFILKEHPNQPLLSFANKKMDPMVFRSWVSSSAIQNEIKSGFHIMHFKKINMIFLLNHASNGLIVSFHCKILLVQIWRLGSVFLWQVSCLFNSSDLDLPVKNYDLWFYCLKEAMRNKDYDTNNDEVSRNGIYDYSKRKKVRLAEELSRSVMILTFDSSTEVDNCDVYLVGTTHVSHARVVFGFCLITRNCWKLIELKFWIF